MGLGIFGFVGGLEDLPEESGDDGTDDGCDYEQPDLLDSQGAALGEHQECGAEGPRGVDGGAGQSDGHEMDQDQCQTYDDSDWAAVAFVEVTQGRQGQR